MLQFHLSRGFISQNVISLVSFDMRFHLRCTDTSKWATYRVASYPILHFLCVKSMSLLCLLRVLVVSMLYPCIIGFHMYLLSDKVQLLTQLYKMRRGGVFTVGFMIQHENIFS